MVDSEQNCSVYPTAGLRWHLGRALDFGQIVALRLRLAWTNPIGVISPICTLVSCMTTGDILTHSELASLQEIGRGLRHGSIPEADALRLVELRLIYRLLGDLRMTTAGRIRNKNDF